MALTPEDDPIVMDSKEKILENNDVQDMDFYFDEGRSNVLKAMDEYAKQEAIEFANWIESL